MYIPAYIVNLTETYVANKNTAPQKKVQIKGAILVLFKDATFD